MKKRRRPKDMYTLSCWTFEKNARQTIINIGIMRSLTEARKVHAWLGRVIEYLEQKGGE